MCSRRRPHAAAPANPASISRQWSAAAATAGGLGSLAVSQRVQLIKHLFSGVKTWESEEDAAFSVLTANPAHIQEVIDKVGWDELEDELGDRFSDAYPKP